MRGGRDLLADAGRVGQARVFEQPELELQQQDACDRAVERVLGDEPLVERFARSVEEARRSHHHVVAAAWA